jgi:hypothetical protein
MRRARTIAVSVLAAAAAALACGVRDTSSPPAPDAGEGRWLELAAGVHRLRVQQPSGWEHLDQGREHRFRSGIAQLSITDHGPVAGAGYRARLRHVRELWLDGRGADASAAMARIDVAPERFATHAERERFTDLWNQLHMSLRGPERGLDRQADIQRDFDDLQRMLRLSRDPEVEELLPGLLEAYQFDSQRAIASVENVQVGDRTATIVETWDKLSHNNRRRYALISNEGSLLVVWTAFGGAGQTLPGFETLVDSLEFHGAAQHAAR